MEKRVLAVLRSGGEFQPKHVQALQRQAARWAPTAKFACLSDVDVPGVERIPLKHDWPGWWSKMALFDPAIEGDIFCTDLDNVFLGPLDDILSVTEYTTQRGQSNALAFYPAAVRAKIWEEWMRDPAGHMHRFAPENAEVKHRFGDGGFIASVVTSEQCWEDLFPGQVMNIVLLKDSTRTKIGPWRANEWPLRAKNIPADTRVFLCYQPWRPWLLPVFKLMRLYD